MLGHVLVLEIHTLTNWGLLKVESTKENIFHVYNMVNFTSAFDLL